MKKQYLIDANIIIEAARNYYAFDFTQAFWSKLAVGITSGQLIIIDKVYDEIFVKSTSQSRNSDALNKWLEAYAKNYLLKVEDNEAHVLGWRELSQSIEDNIKYTNKAYNTWFSDDTVADPWLIVVAQEDSSFTIVTHERKMGDASKNQQYDQIKIPNIAEGLGIRCINLYTMMRELGIQLDS